MLNVPERLEFYPCNQPFCGGIFDYALIIVEYAERVKSKYFLSRASEPHPTTPASRCNHPHYNQEYGAE